MILPRRKYEKNYHRSATSNIRNFRCFDDRLWQISRSGDEAKTEKVAVEERPTQRWDNGAYARDALAQYWWTPVET